ncbi:aminoacyl-tRNA hydrolase [uncultured Clostridium sp.]|uniref:aminoacyl-tRNA hydrolase n=1 Tax=uncultured Clostridium sp. TaxID=59620 RepID=UPI0025EF7790|nr:aminoacyl-tRNA hydrolase [uncultured Clostridium sp.]
MYIIAGLGNPGKEYDGSRHNVGFMTLETLADRYQIDIREKAHKALIGKGMIEGNKVILVKPQTYMNLSGESIRSVMDYYKTEPSEFIVIYDDISLEPGQIRIRKKGSAGGHNGIKNIIAHLGTQEFPRIRIGVGEKPPRMDLADYVLSRFPKEEKEEMEQAFSDGAAAAVSMMNEGIDTAMNRFNGSARAPKKETKQPEEQTKA